MKILVGLSGGVDSAVCAYILKDKGHEVAGATMSIWGKNGIAKNSGKKNACYGPDEIEDIEIARKIAKQIGIEYYVFDCKKEYDEIVLEDFKREYVNGGTPNPCIWCNTYIKFGVLPKLAKNSGLNFEKFATGHYAKIGADFGLYRAKDKKKDQSYFLYRLTKEKLKNILLPLGNYTKDEVREIARKAGILAADKPDSQDFYSGDYNELLGVKEKIGNIVDTDGKILGKHKGIWNYTVGQRKGVGISAKEAMYVLSLNKEKNEVVIGPIDKTFKTGLIAENLSWISDMPDFSKPVTAKFRSTQEPFKALATMENNKLCLKFYEPQKSIGIGQSVVLYNEERVLGGGIIKETFRQN